MVKPSPHQAPERDVSEDDTETAEFQTRLRRFSAASSGSRASPSNPLSDIIVPPPSLLHSFPGGDHGIIPEEVASPASPYANADESQEVQQLGGLNRTPFGPSSHNNFGSTEHTLSPEDAFDINDDDGGDDDEEDDDVASEEVLSRLRPQRSLDHDDREAEAPEREIEEEDSACAEILNNLRRSRSGDGGSGGGFFPSLRRKTSRGSCTLEVLSEAAGGTSPTVGQADSEEIKSSEGKMGHPDSKSALNTSVVHIVVFVYCSCY